MNAQHPCTLHTLVNDAVNYSVFSEKASHVMGNPKRYATYFPSKASIEAQHRDASDNGSTWEFSAPVSPPSRSSSATSGCTSGSTPAQEIVIRYRSGLSLDLSDTRSSSPSQYSEPDSWEMTSTEPSDVELVVLPPDQDMKARYRQSRHDALLDKYQEAVDVAEAAGLRLNDKVACNRPGCRDTLANVKALMYHFHIHDIHDRLILCPRCKGSYESEQELRMHNCNRRSQQLPTSPLRGMS